MTLCCAIRRKKRCWQHKFNCSCTRTSTLLQVCKYALHGRVCGLPDHAQQQGIIVGGGGDFIVGTRVLLNKVSHLARLADILQLIRLGVVAVVVTARLGLHSSSHRCLIVIAAAVTNELQGNCMISATSC